MLLSETTKPKAGRSTSFLYYEIEAIRRRNLPVVFANINGSRLIESSKIPTALADHYSINVSFQPTIIKYALDNYVPAFQGNEKADESKVGPYKYVTSVYEKLGL